MNIKYVILSFTLLALVAILGFGVVNNGSEAVQLAADTEPFLNIVDTKPFLNIG